MAIVLKDRVKVTSGVTGTGTATLGTASTGYQSFAAVGDGNETYYTIALQSGDEWEVGLGTVTDTAGTFTLSRDTVFESSNAGNLVNFSAGTKDVFVTYPAERAIFEEPDGQTLVDGGPITILGENVTVNPSLEAELGKFVGNVNSFGQVFNLNQSDGAGASADFVVYNDATTDGYTHFTDMGLNSSNYSSLDYPIFTAGSGYVFHQGDDFFIGNETTGKDLVLFAGGVAVSDEVVRISGTDQSVALAGALTVAGAATITGAAEFQSTVLLDADPTLALQAATKQYVDNAVAAGLTIHEPVRLERGSNLNATYDNGTAGVGATLTNAGTQAALVIDGVTVEVADRILVYGQTTTTQNGVYTVTTVGDGSTNWVLTRATDADTYGTNDPTKLDEGAYFYVTSGDTGAGESYVVTTVGTITFGTTAITFSQFSASPTYAGGTNIDISGQTISLTGTVDPTNGGTGVNTVTTGDLLYGSASNTWSKLPKGAAYKSLVMDGSGTNVEWNAVALDQSGSVSGALGTTHGGTNITTYTLGDILYSSATNTLAKLAGNTTTTKTFLTQTGAGGSVSAAPAWGTIDAADVSGLAASATTDTTNAANITTGTLGTGRLSGSYTGITGVGTLAAGTWNGSVIGSVYGGTGFGSYAVGDLLYADTTTSLAKLAGVATGNALISGGTNSAFSWGKIGLATHVSGTLPIANGGTNATTEADARTNLGLGTTADVQFDSLGVGTAASGTSGEIRATNNITAYYSDDRLKTKLGNIENALDKVRSLSGFYYEANEVAQAFGYEVKREVGVSAQQVQAVQPEVVAPAPIDENYLTVRYERLVPLLIEAIKELDGELQSIKQQLKGD